MAVEREMFRGQFGEGKIGVACAVICGITLLFPLLLITARPQDRQSVVSPFKSKFDGISQPDPNSIADYETVDHAFDGVAPVFLQSNRVGPIELDNFAIDAGANKTFPF